MGLKHDASVLTARFDLGTGGPDHELLLNCASAFSVSIFAQNQDQGSAGPKVNLALIDQAAPPGGPNAPTLNKALHIPPDTTIAVPLGSVACEPGFVVSIRPFDTASVEIIVSGICPDGDQIQFEVLGH